MKININRICELAGIESKSHMLNEASNRSMHEDPGLSGEAEHRYGSNQLSEYGNMDMADPQHDTIDTDLEETYDDPDEMIEIDEVELVQELRRAKKLMREARRKKRNISLQEAEIKSIIDDEVKNVMRELNLSNGWVYGDNKPKRSRKGYVHQGSFLKGIGFK